MMRGRLASDAVFFDYPFGTAGAALATKGGTVRRASVVSALVLACGVAAPVFADGITNAKIQCQVEYGSGSKLGTACQRGVELAATHAADGGDDATRACTQSAIDPGSAAACRRGVVVHTRQLARTRVTEESGFSATWKKGRAPLQVEVGDYQVLIGDAEKSIEDCMRAFEGNATPPSCLSGITGQRKPEPAPR